MTTPLLKIALLGDDPAAIAWLHALNEATPRWAELVFAVGFHPSYAAELARLFPSVRFGNDWTELLAARNGDPAAMSEPSQKFLDVCDIVLLAGAEPSHLEGAKRLVGEGKPLVLFPRPEQESAFAYEMSLIRDDTHSLLIPVFPDRASPAIRELKRRLETGELGRILQIELDREIPVASTLGELPLLDRKTTRTELLADVDLIRHLGGRYEQVTAMLSNVETESASTDLASMHSADDYTSTGEESISQSAAVGEEPGSKRGKKPAQTEWLRRDILRATVTLSGANRPKGIWTLKPISVNKPSQSNEGRNAESNAVGARFHWRSRSAMTLTITTEKGIARLQEPLDELHPTLTWNGAALMSPEEMERGGGMASANPTEKCARNSEGIPHRAADLFRHSVEQLRLGLAGEKVSPDWSDLTQALETVEAGDRSIRRRRTIDLYFETTSERSQFKTQMAAAGCAVLMWTLVGVPFVLVIGAVPGIPAWLMHVLRMGVFLPLFVFLALQLLLVLARPSPSADGT